MAKQISLEPLITPRLKIVPLTRQEFDEARAQSIGGASFQEAMQELAERAAEDKPIRFAWYTNRLIYRSSDNVLIGSIAFMNSPEKDPDKLGLVEIGYETNEPYRSQGYMTEAVAAMCGWALEQPKVYGIIAGVQDGNPASERVLQKCGFIKTDHSDALSLSVYKRIPDGRKPMSFWERIF